MPDPQPPPRKVPLGEPLRWDDSDLDALSQVGPQDVLEAQAWAREHDEKLGALLDAEPQDDAAPP